MRNGSFKLEEPAYHVRGPVLCVESTRASRVRMVSTHFAKSAKGWRPGAFGAGRPNDGCYYWMPRSAEHLGLGFIHSQQVVAGRAVLRNARAVFGRVVAIVAAEAARIAHVADVVGMRSPGHLHDGKDILAVDRHQFLAGGFDQSGLGGQHLGMLGADRRPQAAAESWRAPRPGWRSWP